MGKVSLASSSFPKERGSHGFPPTSSNPVAERAEVTGLTSLDGANALAEDTRAAAVVRAIESLVIFIEKLIDLIEVKNSYNTEIEVMMIANVIGLL